MSQFLPSICDTSDKKCQAEYDGYPYRQAASYSDYKVKKIKFVQMPKRCSWKACQSGGESPDKELDRIRFYFRRLHLCFTIHGLYIGRLGVYPKGCKEPESWELYTRKGMETVAGWR